VIIISCSGSHLYYNPDESQDNPSYDRIIAVGFNSDPSGELPEMLVYYDEKTNTIKRATDGNGFKGRIES
jgi:hypothetical protein